MQKTIVISMRTKLNNTLENEMKEKKIVLKVGIRETPVKFGD